MPRFFVSPDDISENTVSIKDSDAYHIARALRMAVGDEVTACDGSGREYICRLSKIRDDNVLCDIISSCEGKSESPVKITLYMAYPKGDKLETVIQKAVELGACKIIPFESSRCIKRPKAEKAEKQSARLNRIAAEAAGQSQRCVIPTVGDCLSYKAMIAEAAKCDIPIFCYEGCGAVSLKQVLNSGFGNGDGENSTSHTLNSSYAPSDDVCGDNEGAESHSDSEKAKKSHGNSRKPKTLSVIVGSEGGFSPEEAQYAKNAGIHIVNLGPRILRCETAPLFSLSSICYHFEL